MEVKRERDRKFLKEKGFVCLFDLQSEDIQSSKVAEAWQPYQKVAGYIAFTVRELKVHRK